MKNILIFSCPGMFRDVPGCSMFRVLSTPSRDGWTQFDRLWIVAIHWGCNLRLVESVKSKFGVILIFQNVAFHTQKRWTSWNFRKFPPWRVYSKCRVSGDHFHGISVEERQSRANWWSIRGTYKVKTCTFWTRPIARREGNGPITLKSLFKIFFRVYVLCACKKGTKITDTHKNMAFMKTRMWHRDSTWLTGSSWWFEYDGAGEMQLRTGPGA